MERVADVVADPFPGFVRLLPALIGQPEGRIVAAPEFFCVRLWSPFLKALAIFCSDSPCHDISARHCHV